MVGIDNENDILVSTTVWVWHPDKAHLAERESSAAMASLDGWLLSAATPCRFAPLAHEESTNGFDRIASLQRRRPTVGISGLCRRGRRRGVPRARALVKFRPAYHSAPGVETTGIRPAKCGRILPHLVPMLHRTRDRPTKRTRGNCGPAAPPRLVVHWALRSRAPQLGWISSEFHPVCGGWFRTPWRRYSA